MHQEPSQENNGKGSAPSFVQLDPGIEDRDLRIEIFTICDGATEQDGRLSLVGTYEAVGASSFPLIIAQMTVVLRLRFWPGEQGEHAVRLALTGPDGRLIGQAIDGKVRLVSADEERSGAYNLIVQIQNTRLEEPGEYIFDFHLNGRLEGRLPFCARHQPIALSGIV